MKTKNSNVIVGISLIILLFASPLRAQQPSMEDLQKEIQALSQVMKAMQKDLADIRAMLQSRAPAPPPENVLLDLGNRPFRGDRAARLILVEFSDYQ
jgi:protein-disulfide isomerase